MMCNRERKSIVFEDTSDIYGNRLTFSSISYGAASNCKEYVVSQEAFSIRRWLFFMSIFSSIAFYWEFYNTNSSFLGFFLFILCLVFGLKLHLKVKEESLLVIASIGLQLTTTFVTGRKASKFIFHSDIYDVVINEGFFMQRIIFYLAVLLKDMDNPLKIASIIPLFEHTFPRLHCLSKIYNQIQSEFFESCARR